MPISINVSEALASQNNLSVPEDENLKSIIDNKLISEILLAKK